MKEKSKTMKKCSLTTVTKKNVHPSREIGIGHHHHSVCNDIERDESHQNTSQTINK